MIRLLHFFLLLLSACAYAHTPEPGTGDLVRQLNLPGGSVRTNYYGTSGELKQSWLKDPLGAVVDSSGYSYDLSWLRTNATRSGGVNLNYFYDQIGQLAQVLAFGPGKTNRLNETYGYWYDAAGNLRLRTNGATSVTFSSDKLNQLTNSTRGSSMTVSGSLATNAWNVTVNNVGARVYHDYTFSTLSGVSLNNGANTFTTKAVDWQNFTNTLVTSANLPVSVNLLYDRNGNLTNDGLRSFEYDSADRLTAVYVPYAWRTEFVYDGLWRRRITREKAWQGGGWVTTNETRSICLGRNVVQQRNGFNNPTVTYTCGLDLSATFDGAGGIGGLLARTDVNGAAFYHNDGAGNVTTLINSQGQKQASYAYDSFGNTVDMRGSLAGPNLIRHSSKEFINNANLYYYGFRFYEPNLQRWLNQDPIGLAGGLNQYGFVGNNPMSYVDPLGLADAYISEAQSWSEAFTQGIPGPLPYVKSEGWGNDRWYDYIVGPVNNVISTGGNALFRVADNVDQAVDWIEGQTGGPGSLAMLPAIRAERTGMSLLDKFLKWLKCKRARPNANLIQEAATRAENAIGGTGRFAGTDKHTYAKRFLDKYQGIYGDRGLRTETTWLNHNQVRYGTAGGPRIDVLNVNANWAYDYKFTINPPGLSPARTQQIMTHGPRGLGGVTEVNP